MTETKFVKTPKLFEYLDLEVTEALHRHGIRDMFDYALVGEDTPSDEFIGLAMWGSEHHSPVLHGFHVPSGYSRDEYERLITACEDLESLMQLARLAIGHALWMSDLIKSESRNLFHHHHFWLNHINGVTLLGMASDRLRDVFIAAYFRKSFAEYKKANSKRFIKPVRLDSGPLRFEESHRNQRNLDPGELGSGFYQYPFADASSAPCLPGIAANLAELFDMAGRIYRSRESRNATVHDLATTAAKFLTEFIRADSPGIMSRNPASRAAILENHRRAHEANCAELDEAVRFVTEWYRDLVKASSITFEVEHALARSPAHAC